MAMDEDAEEEDLTATPYFIAIPYEQSRIRSVGDRANAWARAWGLELREFLDYSQLYTGARYNQPLSVESLPVEPCDFPSIAAVSW